MDLAKGALNRASVRARGGQEEQRHPGVRCQPLLYGLRFVNLIVSDYPLEGRETPRRLCVVKRLEEG
jgi:hypothetical protein